MNFTDIDREDFRSFLSELVDAHIPFGKYGPKEYPPRGVPLIDLPPEYFQWFHERGWPSGRLGELMSMIAEIKSAGADHVFDPIRKARGGRVSVRRRRPKTGF
ncbi:MAG: putative quorum-sensing-regulated virulence factor [Akkermansiaceae bacterium]